MKYCSHCEGAVKKDCVMLVVVESLSRKHNWMVCHVFSYNCDDGRYY